MTRMALLAMLVLAASPFASAQDPASKSLKLTLAADRTRVQVGQDVQFEVRLENSGDKEVEIAELTYEERSLSFAVSGTFTGSGDRKRDYVLAISRPEPQIAARLPLMRVTLAPKKSVNLLQRFPAVATGSFAFTARYAGGDGEVASAPVTIQVEAAPQGNRLSAIVEVEEAGTFRIALSPEVSPCNVTHFVSLVNRGFYNESLIHRIVRNNWIHMGCPYGLGVGGPGYAVKAELDRTIRHERGSVSLSVYEKSGYTGSQFFVCVTTLPSLDGKYTPIGRVDADDMTKVVEPISKKDTDRNTDAPRQPVKIKSVSIVVVK